MAEDKLTANTYQQAAAGMRQHKADLTQLTGAEPFLQAV
jgi:hypothetical protein